MKHILYFLILIPLFFLNSCGNKTRQSSQFQNNAKISLKKNDKTAIDSVNFKNKDNFESYIVEKLDNSQGLSNSSINAVFQDSENIIWVGTWDGLNRYDGHQFKVFRPELDNENSLSSQVVLKISEDRFGYIWLLTMAGIDRYHKASNTFKRFNFSYKNNSTLTEGEFNMAVTKNGEVFCAVTNWGLGVFKGSEFVKIGVRNLPTANVRSMSFTQNNELLLLFDNEELFLLSFSDAYKSNSSVVKISENTKSFKYLNSDVVYLLNTEGVVNKYSLATNSNLKFRIENVKKILEGESDEIVYLTEKGAFLVGEKKNIWLKPLGDRELTTCVKGNEGVLWFGSDGDGILKLFSNKELFKLLSSDDVSEMKGGVVRAFEEVKSNSLFVGTKGRGLFQFFKGFEEGINKETKYKNYNNQNSSINNSVYALHSGKDDLLFIGTDGEGLTFFDLKHSKIINWSEVIASEKCELFKSVYAIYQDEKGFIWLGTNGYGLVCLKVSRVGQQLKLVYHKQILADLQKTESLSSNIIFSIEPNNTNELWIGTRLGGLNLFHKKTATFKIFKHQQNHKKSLSSNDILSLQKDNKDRLWVGTSHGLNLLEGEHGSEKSFKRYTVSDGLPNNMIHGIVFDENSNLWLSTNFGLSNFIVEENKFINYTKDEGLQNNEFSDGAYYQSPYSSFVYIGGIKGFNYFLPQKREESLYIPDLFIKKISGQNESVPYIENLIVKPNTKNIPFIELAHNQNFFDVNLTALTYRNSEKCTYAYQLEGFDNEWKYIGNRKTISFTNVPKGNYSLKLKWTNIDGVWSAASHAIDIQINPIIWESHGAYFVYTLLMISLLFFILSYYKKQSSLKRTILFREKDEEIHQNRLTFFTNIAHEFQTPLTLIVGPVQKLLESENLNEQNKKLIGMIQRNSSRLLLLTEQLLEFRKAENDHLDVKVNNFDLVNLVEQIAELFDELAF